MTKPRISFLLLIVIALVQASYYYPRMPAVMASHFDGAGNPNAYVSRDSFFALFAFVLGLIVFAFGAPPVLLRRLPISWINLPHREYWLSPARREDSLARITDELTWFGVASLVMFLFISELVYRANLEPEPRLSPALWVLLAAYLLFAVFWTVHFYRSFRPPA